MSQPSYTELDVIYGTRLWTAKWSDGANIPLLFLAPSWFYAAFPASRDGRYDWYPRGLWLFAADGSGIVVPTGHATHAGIRVHAYTREHAVEVFQAVLGRSG